GVIYATLTDISTSNNVNRLVTVGTPGNADAGIFNRVGNSTGAILVGGAHTNITGLDFMADGRLVAINYQGTGQGQLIAIDSTDTTLSTQLSGFSSDFDAERGISAYGSFLYGVQNIDDGDDLLLTSSLEYGYYSINASNASANLLGVLVDSDGTNITDVFTAVALNAADQMYAVRRVRLEANTRLAALNGGLGVSINNNNDFTINLSGSVSESININLSPTNTLTVDDVITAINASATNVTASLDANGFLVLTAPLATDTITVTAQNGSTAASDLGILTAQMTQSGADFQGAIIAGDSLYLVQADADADGDAELTPLGLILVGGNTINIESMVYTRDDKLVGYDDTNQLVVIDYEDPTNSQLILSGTSYTNLRGLTIDSEGLFYSLNDNALINDTLKVSGSGQSILTYDDPGDIAGGGLTPDTQADFEVLIDGGSITQQVTGLATNGTDVFAVRNVNGQDLLFAVNPTTGAIVELGAVQVGGIDTQINGMDFRDGRLVALDELTESLVSIGYPTDTITDPFADPADSVYLSELFSVDSFNIQLVSDSNGFFYTYDTVTSELRGSTNVQSVLSFDKATGLVASQINLQDSSGNILDRFTGLSRDSDNNLYGVLRDETNSQDILYTIDEATGIISQIAGATDGTGVIKVGDVTFTTISAIEFARDGSLFATDILGNQLLRIDLSDPLFSESIVNSADSLADFDGFTSDADGLFYSIAPNSATVPDEGRDLLIQSSSTQKLFEFTAPSTSTDVGGTDYAKATDSVDLTLAGSDISNSVTGLAFNVGDDLFVAIQTSTGSEILWVDVPVTGIDFTAATLTLTSIGTVNINSAVVSIDEMDFNSDNTLIAIDRLSQTMIVVDTTTPANSLLLDDSVDVANLMGLSIGNGTANMDYVYGIRSDSDTDGEVELVASTNNQGLYYFDVATGFWTNYGDLTGGNIGVDDTITALAMLNGYLYGTLRDRQVDITADSLLTRLLNGYTVDNTAGQADISITRGDNTNLLINLIDQIDANTLISEIGGFTELNNASSDIRITDTSGNTYDVNFDTATDINDVITLINTALTGSTVSVSIDIDGTGLQLIDTGTGTDATLRVQNLGDSTAATDLGILGTDDDGDGIILGSYLTHRTVQDLIDAVNNDASNISKALISLNGVIPANGETLIINDGEGHTVTFEFYDNTAADYAGSNTMIDTQSATISTILDLLGNAVIASTSTLNVESFFVSGSDITLYHTTTNLENDLASVTASGVNLQATNFGVVRLSITDDATGLQIVDGIEGANAVVLTVADTGAGTAASDLDLDTSAAVATDNTITSADLRGDQDILVTIAPDASVTRIGAISIDGGSTTTEIKALEAGTDNNLIGYTVDGTMISIDYANDPSDSIAISSTADMYAAGTLNGMATDADGFVYAFDANNDFFVSDNQQSLWQVDSTNGEATQNALDFAAVIASATDLDETVVAVAYNAVTDRIIAVTGDTNQQRVWVIQTDGTIDSVCNITYTNTGASAINVMNIIAMEYTSTGRLLAINEGLTGRQYVEINTTTGVASYVNAEGTLSDDLVGLTADEDGRFYSVGDDNLSNNVLYTSTGDIYTASSTTPTIQGNASALATSINTVPITMLGNVTGLAFDQNDTLYAVSQQQVDSTFVDTLYQLELSGQATNLGAINVIDGNTDETDPNEDFTQIIGMDFTSDNELLAFDDATALMRDNTINGGAGVGDGVRLIQINLDEPGLSTSLTAPVDTDYAGLTIDSEDRLISYDATNKQLLITSDTPLQVLFMITHDVVAGTATFDILGTIDSENLIVNLAMNPVTQALYGVMRDKGDSTDPTDNYDRLIDLNYSSPVTIGTTDYINFTYVGDGTEAGANILRTDGTHAQIIGMDFGIGDVDDDTQRDLYLIDESDSDGPSLILLSDTNADDDYDPNDSTFMQFMGNNLDSLNSFTSDGYGVFYSHNQTTNMLMTSGTIFVAAVNHDAPVLTGSVGGVIGQDQRVLHTDDTTGWEFTFVDIAADNAGDVWAVVIHNEPTIGEYDLMKVIQDPDTREVIGFEEANTVTEYIHWPTTSLPPVLDITAIDAHPGTGQLFIAAEDTIIASLNGTSALLQADISTLLPGMTIVTFAFSNYQPGQAVPANSHPEITLIVQDDAGIQYVTILNWDSTDALVSEVIPLIDENGNPISVSAVDYNAQGYRNPMLTQGSATTSIESDLIALESVDPNNPNSRVLYRIGTGRSDEPLGTVTTVTN
ncbi:MAG TPA: hypothetical protein DCM28_09375, partial [Phycisphaerales bacterium]|nr:hypothetical protein [Phycisphaerales bacterium]